MFLFARRLRGGHSSWNNVVGAPVQRGGTNEITELCHLTQLPKRPLWAFLIVNAIIIYTQICSTALILTAYLKTLKLLNLGAHFNAVFELNIMENLQLLLGNDF